MKTMDWCSGRGANNSHSSSHGEDLQRGPGCEDAFSCSDTFGLLYRASLPCIVRLALTSVLLIDWRSQALGLGSGSGLTRGTPAWAWRDSAKLRKNLHQMVLPAMAVQVL